MISTGRVMIRRVIITVFGLGSAFEEPRLKFGEVVEMATACRAVDNRDTKMEPTLPGKPVQR